MHYHLEIVMPPTDDVKGAVEQIMAPFDENADRSDEDASSSPFWDWWQLGGRYSGSKMLDALGRERLDAFYKALTEAKVTVSSFTAGKQTLQPACQAGKVDALWNDMFPDAPVKQCPIFDNYKADNGDVMRLSDLPPRVEAEHVIIAGPNWKGEKLEACYMVRDSIWNGVTHQNTTWDKTLAGALSEWTEKLDGYKEEWRAQRTPRPDWLVVTVDYHS